MNKTLRMLALVLTLVMAVFAFAACGSKDVVENTDGATANDAAEEVKEIVFGTNAEFPPFEFVTASGVIGEFDGIDMAIADKIAKDNGMVAKISNTEFDSLLIALENGQVDAVIAGMTVTEERAQKVNFSTPYYQATQVMIVKEGTEIKKAADMEGKKIAVIQGYTGETCVSEMGYEYTSFKKGTDAIMELVNGKADVVVIDSATATKYVNDNEGLVIVEDGEAFASEEYAIAVKKDNTELLDMINKSIEAMLADGTISEFAAKYAVAE